MIGCLLCWSGKKNWRTAMRKPKKKKMPSKKKPALPKRGQRTKANKKVGKRRK